MATAATEKPFVARHGDTVLAFGLTGVLIALIVPLPPFLLDVLLTFNIAYVLLLMMVVLSVNSPLELSTFSSLLLIATLFRLSLNVASTRLILLHAYAGEVIGSFGEFVVGGQMVVGLVIFFILVVIQFVVITKGADRISEVTARFTLDSLPGKQMSIDADLNAGLIDGEEARQRRQEIVEEADFYGAMDGACKYVRGDAIAGIIIVLINLVGGIVIGLTKGMEIPEAIKTYSLLTVGDGLVTQIPAVIMSTAAGILITTSSSEEGLSRELGLQIFARHRPIAIAGVIMFAFMMMPGLPSVPFFLLGVGMIALFFILRRNREEAQAQEAAAEAKEEAQQEQEEAEENVEALISPDRISVEVGYNLIRMVDPKQGGTLLERIRTVRKKFAKEKGVIIPKIRILDNVELEGNTYRVKLAGHTVASGEIYPGRLMAMNPAGQPQGLKGIETTEPSFGLPVVWINEQQKEKAEEAGYTVVDPASVFITHITEVLRAHADEILNRQDVRRLLDNLKEDYPDLVDDLVPDVLSVGQLQEVLENLLTEGIPVNNLAEILEACGKYAQQAPDTGTLTEMVRKSLSRAICGEFSDEEGRLRALTLDPVLEEEIRQSLQTENGQTQLTMAPDRVRQMAEAISNQTGRALETQGDLVILTDPELRTYIRQMAGEQIPVISYDELCESVDIETVDMITLSDEQFGSERQAQDTQMAGNASL